MNGIEIYGRYNYSFLVIDGYLEVSLSQCLVNKLIILKYFLQGFFSQKSELISNKSIKKIYSAHVSSSLMKVKHILKVHSVFWMFVFAPL